MSSSSARTILSSSSSLLRGSLDCHLCRRRHPSRVRHEAVRAANPFPVRPPRRSGASRDCAQATSRTARRSRQSRKCAITASREPCANMRLRKLDAFRRGQLAPRPGQDCRAVGADDAQPVLREGRRAVRGEVAVTVTGTPSASARSRSEATSSPRIPRGSVRASHARVEFAEQEAQRSMWWIRTSETSIRSRRGRRAAGRSRAARPRRRRSCHSTARRAGPA